MSRAASCTTLAVVTDDRCKLCSSDRLRASHSEEKAPRVGLRTPGGGRSAPPHNCICKYDCNVCMRVLTHFPPPIAMAIEPRIFTCYRECVIDVSSGSAVARTCCITAVIKMPHSRPSNQLHVL